MPAFVRLIFYCLHPALKVNTSKQYDQSEYCIFVATETVGLQTAFASAPDTD